MFPISLAPTSAPKRWYSNQHSIQDEFDELAYLEAKFVHDREQALEVRCPMIVPPSTFTNNSSSHIDDPSMDDMEAAAAAHDDGDVMLSGEVDVTFVDDLPPIDNNDHMNNAPGSLSFLSQHEDHQTPSSQQHYYNSSMISTTSYSTPHRTAAAATTSNFFTTPTPTAHHHHSASSPDLVDYLSPSPAPPAGRSLRQYMDDSSRGFLEPEMMDRLIRYDDDDDGLHGNDNDDHDDEPRRMRRSNLFD